jgi:transcriptional regulator
VYIPTAFCVPDAPRIHELMREHSFATLVTWSAEGPFATHLPLLLDASRGPYGTLRGHVARANRQWHDFESGGEALAIFHGPHSYVSPSWYDAELAVPTWNYAAVHAYGPPRVTEDRDEVIALLRDLVTEHEAGFESPWTMALPDDFVHKMVQGIVAFEIEITRLEGKAKLGQNRSDADRAQVHAMLSASSDQQARGTAQLMERFR